MKPQLLDLFAITPTFSNFIELKNEKIVHSLSNYSRQFTHIVGLRNSGKTHLLRAWSTLAKNNHFSSIYLDLGDLIGAASLEPLIHGLAHYQYIAIDNLDVANTEQVQLLLFDLFNLLKQNNNYLLTSSRQNLDKLSLRLDLKTRLLSGLNLCLKSLSDEEILLALMQVAKQEGISISHLELNYLLKHYTRNIGYLIIIMREIADAGVTEKRSITIPLIKKILSKMDIIDEEN